MLPSFRKYYKRSKSLITKRKARLSNDNRAALEWMLEYSEDLRKAHFIKELFVDILDENSSPYNQVFFSINSILFDTCHWIELRLWSDLYLIQGRYIVIMGAPNKTSSLFVLNGLDVYPSLYGSSPLMSNGIILLTVGPHFLRSACP